LQHPSLDEPLSGFFGEVVRLLEVVERRHGGFEGMGFL
jgi:hypothetical protein